MSAADVSIDGNTTWYWPPNPVDFSGWIEGKTLFNMDEPKGF
jgi:hypothetical protein